MNAGITVAVLAPVISSRPPGVWEPQSAARVGKLVCWTGTGTALTVGQNGTTNPWSRCQNYWAGRSAMRSVPRDPLPLDTRTSGSRSPAKKNASSFAITKATHAPSANFMTRIWTERVGKLALLKVLLEAPGALRRYVFSIPYKEGVLLIGEKATSDSQLCVLVYIPRGMSREPA